MKLFTVFPRNLAAARLYFKAQFGAATIQGWLDFEGGVYRDRHARVYAASIISLFVCTYSAHMYIPGDPLPCSEISRVAIIGLSLQKHAVRFQGQRDFEEGEILRKYGNLHV